MTEASGGADMHVDFELSAPHLYVLLYSDLQSTKSPYNLFFHQELRTLESF